MKNILVVNGHPDKESFNNAIAMAYIALAEKAGATVRYIPIAELNFNPNLQFGYRKRMELEPDLLKALEDLQRSEHQVWIYPIWWLGMPAIMKGFFDRAFLPGLTFKTNKEGKSEGLLTGKSGRIITTAGDLSMDLYEQLYKSSGLVQLKDGILQYCGVSTIQTNFIGPLIEFNEDDRKKVLEEIKMWVEKDLGKHDANLTSINP